MKVFRFFSKFFAISIPLLLLVLVMSYSIISNHSRQRIFDDPALVPPVKVGLLLGTSPRTRSGTASEFFNNRISAAVELYNSRTVEFILASGDNGSIFYNEPVYMQKELMRRGVPADRIVLDYAGFSTLDSVIRARQVFGQEELIIISQRFHNERALYIASSENIRAYGFNADSVGGYAGASVLAREVLARIKALLDVHIFSRQPRFLGDPEIIPSAGSVEPGAQLPSDETGPGDAQ